MPVTPAPLLIAVLLSTASAAQTPIPKPPTRSAPAPPSKTREQQVAVTIQGCVNGAHFRPTVGSLTVELMSLLSATEFVLDGPRELMQQLTHDHEGHEESITGMAIVPPQPSGATVDIQSVKRGKTTVTGGVRDSANDQSLHGSPDMKLPVRIKVQSATHIAEKCVPAP
jgi:hypothetical protein